MPERGRTIAVGATTLVGIIGLMVMLWIFGAMPDWLGRSYQMTLKLPSAAGLAPGSRVLLSGIDIGQVESVTFDEPFSHGVSVVCRIRTDVQIPAQAQAHIDQQLIGGSPRVALSVPAHVDRDNLTYLPQDGTAELRGDVPTLAGSFGHEVRQALEEPVAHLDRATTSFESLSQEWERVGQNINRMIEPRAQNTNNPSNPDEALDPLANIPDVLAQFDARLRELEPVIAGAQRYMDDDELYEDVRMTAANARQVSEDLSVNLDELSRTIQEQVDELGARYIALADDLGAGVQAIERLAQRIEEGEGTLGMLVNDPALYENLNDAAERMQIALDEMRLLVERWRVEGVPVRW